MHFHVATTTSTPLVATLVLRLPLRVDFRLKVDYVNMHSLMFFKLRGNRKQSELHPIPRQGDVFAFYVRNVHENVLSPSIGSYKTMTLLSAEGLDDAVHLGILEGALRSRSCPVALRRYVVRNLKTLRGTLHFFILDQENRSGIWR